MLKLTGACLVLGAAVLFGFQLKQQLKLHVRQLIGLKEILLMLSGEISYIRTPLEEAFLHVGQKGMYPFNNILEEVSQGLKEEREKSLDEIWKNAIKKKSEELVLSGEELQIFLNVGGHLGFQDIKTQEKHIELFVQQLDNHISKAQEELASKQKVYQYLSVACGLFLVLILI